MALTITRDSATIGSTEYFVLSDSTTATYQTSDLILEVWFDLSALQVGDTYRIRAYEKVDGTNARTVFDSSAYTGVQSPPLKRIEVGIVGEGYEVSIQKTGGTDRVIAWSIRTAS